MMFFVSSAFAAQSTAKQPSKQPVKKQQIAQQVKQTAAPAAASDDMVPLPPRAKSYERYTEMYNIYNGDRLAKIVMIGDSITNGAYWNELMHRGDIINRGIPGDTTQGMLERMTTFNTGTIEKAFILAGINDIAKHQPVNVIFERYVRIVDFLKRSGVTPYIQSTLFLSVKNPNCAVVNKQVAELDGLLKDYASKNGIEYVDLNSVLSDGTQMIDDYSYDGTHLNAKGYMIWRAALSKYMEPQYELPAQEPVQTSDAIQPDVSVQPAN